MNLAFDFEDGALSSARMKVVGVGGAGGNAVDRMIAAGLGGVEFISVNTDLQALEHNRSDIKVQIGKKTTKGLGAGADPERGRRAVEEDRNAVYEALIESDMVFVTGGMGGGTATGAAPVVAEIAKDIGALTVGIVTKPFLFEGPQRMRRAEEGIVALKENVDTLIVIPNQRLLSIVPKDTPLNAAFQLADDVLLNATKGIADLVSIPGLVNLDFADVRAIMLEMGDALMSSGHAKGENRAVEAARQAIHSPLLEDVTIAGARGVLVNVTGGQDMSLHEVNDATTIVFEEAGSKANIIFGAVIDETMKDEIRVTVIATGLSNARRRSAVAIGRPKFEIDSTKIDTKEIPAIDRIDQLDLTMPLRSNRSLRKVHRAVVPSLNDDSHKDQDNGFDNNNGNGKYSKNDNGILNKTKDELEKVDLVEPESEFRDDAYEIPACRRRRWNLL